MILPEDIVRGRTIWIVGTQVEPLWHFNDIEGVEKAKVLYISDDGERIICTGYNFPAFCRAFSTKEEAEKVYALLQFELLWGGDQC